MIKRIEKINEQILRLVLNTNFDNTKNESLFTGRLGVLLYLLSIHQHKNNCALQTKIEEILYQVFHDLSTPDSTLLKQAGIYDGIAGLGYVLYSLRHSDLVDSTFDEQINLINSLIIDHTNKMLDIQFYDFFYGVVGILHYLEHAKEDRLCRLIVDKLLEIGLQNKFIYYNLTGDSYSEGLNFGFAHGSSALVVVLLNLHQRGICVKQTEQIVKGILSAMLKFRKNNLNFDKITLVDTLTNIYQSEFPYNVFSIDNFIDLNESSTSDHNKLHYSGRLAWCNSDLNVLYILIRADHAFKNDEYKIISLEVIENIIQRIAEQDTQTKDSFICHGAAGIALIYRKLFQITGEVKFHTAYQIWIEKMVFFLESECQKYSHVPQVLQLLTGWLGPSLELTAYLNQTNFEDYEKLFLCNYKDE